MGSEEDHSRPHNFFTSLLLLFLSYRDLFSAPQFITLFELRPTNFGGFWSNPTNLAIKKSHCADGCSGDSKTTATHFFIHLPRSGCDLVLVLHPIVLYVY